MNDLSSIIRQVVAFRDERDWAQFHTLRNLAAAIGIEAGELQELLLWKSDEEAKQFLAAGEGAMEARREIADVLIYALLFCTAAQIDPLDAIRAKLEENAAKYPVSLAKGNATKYTQLHEQTE